MGVFKPPKVKDAAFLGQRLSSNAANVKNTSKQEASPKPQARKITRYEALTGNHSIRLLTLHPATNENDDLSCTLTVHDFDDAIPNFTALSYTWGSKKNAEFLRLSNGFQVSITANLHDAMKHLRSAERELIFWIDALCIDQGNVHERGHQVSLMRDIYMVAENVLVWLGPAREGTDPDDQAMVYTDIASRTYWTRVWVIQEFVLGKKVMLQRGHVRHDWDDFYDQFPKDVTQGAKQMRRLFDLKKRYTAQSHGLDLQEAITFALGSEATDPRDKVYGVLGLVQRNSRSYTEAVTADYTLSPCQVYHRVYSHIMSSQAMNMPFMTTRGVYSSPALKNNCKAKRCKGQRCGSFNKLISICSPSAS